MTVLGLTLVVFAVTGMIWLHQHPQALRHRWKPTVVVTRQPAPTIRLLRPEPCESCAAPADIVLEDSSTWCTACHTAALTHGYDNQLGTLL